MKTIRIVLLILIIIGIAAFATQKIWVPKLVNKIVASENTTEVIVQSPVVLKDGRQCYTYSHEATASEPYTTTEFIDMTINGANVIGTKKGTQNGPDMTNGYTGTISGTLQNNTITDIFSYTIEGSHNKEKEIYRASVTGIEKLRYPLIEGKGMLVPDTSQPYATLLYARVGCESSH